MKPCWSRSDTQIPTLGPGILMIGTLGIGLAIGQGSIPEIVLSLIVWPLPILLAIVSSRRYCASDQGLTVRYPFGFQKHYHWEDFSEISLCKVHYASGTNSHTLAIRCVVGKEDFGPGTAICAREDWSTQLYEVQHFRRIITIYHTPERLAEFETHCPCPIRDYRYLRDNWPK